jgi:hypothetical protein
VIRRVALIVGLLALVSDAAVSAYLQLAVSIDGGTARVRWSAPVRWYAAERGLGAISASDFRDAMGRAFDTWQSLPTASVSFTFAGFTSAHPFDEEGLNVLGFEDEPDMERVLGATGFVIDDVTGEIIESDVFFNAAFPWSTAAAGEAGSFDLQSVATHEIGHVIGLGHSALGETELRPGGGRRVLASGAVMFPIAFAAGSIVDRTLQQDDIAAVSDLYPDGGFEQRTGSARGRVLRNGRPVLGAHVIALHLESGEIVAGFTLNAQGEFQIAGLRPGPHVIRAEPLDDGDVESFFADDQDIDVNFRPAFAPRLVVVPPGGASSAVDVTVTAK